MKKNLFLIAASLLAVVSCNKEMTPSVKEGLPIEVTVSITGRSASTKALSAEPSNESKVNSLQIFVFDGDNREAYRSADPGVRNALVPATSGQREVWAIVNAPSLESIQSLSALKAELSRLSDNTISNFVMVGHDTFTLTDSGSIEIIVARIVSRISINKVSTHFVDYRENYSVRLEGAYVINVASNSNYNVDGSPSADGWVNKLGHNDASYDALLYDAINNEVVDNAHAYETAHYFYAYPNSNSALSENEFPAQWSPRGSMLVLEVTMFTGPQDQTGTHGYYPIRLPALERNKTYTIEEVIISRPPSDKPYEPIETGDAQVSITVADWVVGWSDVVTI